jgi:hypothetical protein
LINTGEKLIQSEPNNRRNRGNEEAEAFKKLVSGQQAINNEWGKRKRDYFGSRWKNVPRLVMIPKRAREPEKFTLQNSYHQQKGYES